MKQILRAGFMSLIIFTIKPFHIKGEAPLAGKIETTNSDTLKVNGKAVIFFTITQPEYDSLVKDANSGIDEVLSDFNHYAKAVADSIKKSGYKFIMTMRRYIEVSLDNAALKTYDRLAGKGHVTGYIISDGKKEPAIEYGVGTDEDFLAVFSRFNKRE